MLRSFSAPLLLLLCAALLAAAGIARASSAPVRTDHLQSRLVAETTAAVPGHALTLGLLLEHDPHWHTYWRHSGDSGLPTTLALDLPDGIDAAAIAWPYPHRLEIAGLVNYAYDGRVLLPVTLAIPADYATPTLPIRATATWLVCETGGECIPGKATYAFELPVAPAADTDDRWHADFAAARAALPRRVDTPLAVRMDGDALVVVLSDAAATPARWEWFPEMPGVVANAAGPQWRRTSQGWEARWPKSDYFTALPADLAFVAVDAGDGGEPAAAMSAWRFGTIAGAVEPAPAAGEGTGGGVVPDAVAPGTVAPFRGWPAAVFTLLTLVVAVVLVVSTRRKNRH